MFGCVDVHIHVYMCAEWKSWDLNPWVRTLVEPKQSLKSIYLLLPNQAFGIIWLAQYQDNVTEWDIRSWCWQPGALSNITLGFAKM